MYFRTRKILFLLDSKPIQISEHDLTINLTDIALYKLVAK